MPTKFFDLLKPTETQEKTQEQVTWLITHFDTITQSYNHWVAELEELTIKLRDNHASPAEVTTELQKKAASFSIKNDQNEEVFPFKDEFVCFAAILNFWGSHKVVRKNGEPYTAHPMFVDLIILLMSETTTIEIRIKALLHDLFEEDIQRLWEKKINSPDQGFMIPTLEDPLEENLKKAKQAINDTLPTYKPGDAALDLMAPVINIAEIPESIPEDERDEYQHALFIYWLNWRTEKQPCTRAVKLADKIHDLLDLDYIIKNPNKTEAEIKYKLETKLAKVYFSVYHLTHNEEKKLHSDVPEHLWEVFIRLFNNRLTTYQISFDPESVFYDTYEKYLKYYQDYKPAMHQQCLEYAQKVDLSI